VAAGVHHRQHYGSDGVEHQSCNVRPVWRSTQPISLLQRGNGWSNDQTTAFALTAGASPSRAASLNSQAGGSADATFTPSADLAMTRLYGDDHYRMKDLRATPWQQTLAGALPLPPLTARTEQSCFCHFSKGQWKLEHLGRCRGKTGLQPGCRYAKRANAAGLTGTFVAWLSDRYQWMPYAASTTYRKSLPTAAGKPPSCCGPWVRTDGFPSVSDRSIVGQRKVYAPYKIRMNPAIPSPRPDFHRHYIPMARCTQLCTLALLGLDQQPSGIFR